MAAVIILLLLLVVLAAAGAIALAARSKRKVEAANELDPGQADGAPSSWAGSHDPEAVLHRRLRDALVALRDNPALGDDLSLVELRATLETEAQRIDRQLLAVSRLTPDRRSQPLAQLSESVGLVEQAVATSTVSSDAAAADRMRAAVQGVQEHRQLMDQAWAELNPPPPNT